MGRRTWFKQAIIYQIFIDRFAGFSSTKHWNTPAFLGGNLKGIIQKLPYLQDLGVNTIWISPFYQTSAYHGYHITDFLKIDPHFGTLNDIHELVHQIHEHQMYILADFVPNHCSSRHPFFIHAQQNPRSQYKKWFYFTRWPDHYLRFLSVNQLPKLNLRHGPARNHILQAALYWLDQGFDGYRLDHVIGPSNQFWQWFARNIRDHKKGTVLIGEAWMMGIKFRELNTIHVPWKTLKWLIGGAASDCLLQSYHGLLDGVLDFRFQELANSYIHSKDKQKIIQEIQHRYTKFPKDYFLPTFLDNHDMDRFLFQTGNNLDKLKEAIHIQFQNPQPPIIYYGTETGMTQTKSLWSQPAHGDLLARQPMNWDKPDPDMFSYYQKEITQRKERLKH